MPVRDTASAQPFLSPAERRLHAKEVSAIVKLAAEGKYPPPLWPVAASVGFGPRDLKRLPVDVAAGVAEAQEKLAAKAKPAGRNLAALIDLCGIETLLREDPRDLMVCLRTAASRASALFLARSMRCNEAAMGEQLSYASANVTAVEAQRAGNTGMRLMQASAQMEQVRQKLDIEAGKAERDGILPPEARRDEARRGRNIGERVERDRAREKHQKERDEFELAMALEAAAEEAAKRHATAGLSEAEEAVDGADRHATPYTASEGGTAWSERRLGRGDAATCPAGSSEMGEAMTPAGSRRSDQNRCEMECAADAADIRSTTVAAFGAEEATAGPDRHATPYTVSDIGKADSRETVTAGSVTEPVVFVVPDVAAAAGTITVGDRPTPMPVIAPSSLPVQPPRRGRRAMAAARAAVLAAERAAQTTGGQGGQATPCTVSGSLPEPDGLLPRGAGIPARESVLPVANTLEAYIASATAEPLAPAILPLPLADRRAAASDTLRDLQSPAAKDDPANGWEVEMLGIAVKTGRASASIVARFVEEAGSVDMFPEPGSTAGRRPSFPEFLGRLGPRGSPRVTATASSSISIMP
jgi:hypothetical protein